MNVACAYDRPSVAHLATVLPGSLPTLAQSACGSQIIGNIYELTGFDDVTCCRCRMIAERTGAIARMPRIGTARR